MEQIYTIPVHEAFEESAADAACGCPICTLYRKLEENELELILGASMMEPNTRIQTNKEGFCRTHYDMMFVRKNRLGMALTLESHLAELKEDLKAGLLSSLTGKQGDKPRRRIEALEGSCYVCRRIDFHFKHMIETVVLLFEREEEFPALVKKQPYFCLPHYRLLLEAGANGLQKKKAAEFSALLAEVVGKYMDALSADVSWFCKKFDYRYEEEPWGNAKDSVERAIRFLRADLHRAPGKEKKQ